MTMSFNHLILLVAVVVVALAANDNDATAADVATPASATTPGDNHDQVVAIANVEHQPPPVVQECCTIAITSLSIFSYLLGVGTLVLGICTANFVSNDDFVSLSW